NRESGLGRPDIMVFDVDNERAAIIEVKRASSLKDMQGAAQSALEQIEREQYAEGIPSIFASIVKYGAAFYKKECLVLAPIVPEKR
ncbi:MAG: PD-(D/E)XK nuclease domain-containing protein, partial [Mailhella sp.]